jgi:hypothetical protein
VRRRGLRVAFRERGAAAKKHQVHAREIERGDVGHGQGLVFGDRRAGAAFIVECVQFSERDLSRPQLVDHRGTDQARHADDGHTRQSSAHRVITGVGDTTSAHCARNRKQ